MAKTTQQHNRGRRKCPKRCTLAIYHIGAVILCIGIIVAIVGIATCRLFRVYIYDHRKPARFLHVEVPVGLFSFSAEVTWLSLKKDTLAHGLDLSDGRWRIAQAVTMLGLLLAISSFVLHTIIGCCQAHRTWTTVMFEVCGLLLAVIAILIGLSLAESEIEYIHDHGDIMLTRFLKSNQLLVDADNSPADLKRNPLVEPAPINGDLADQRGVTNGGDFALFLTPPQLSFALLIASDFLLLIAFLAVLIYFVRLCEKAVQTRKQLRRAEVSHI